MMSKLNLFKFIIVVLVLINICVLTVLLIKPKYSHQQNHHLPPRHHKMPKDIIIERLHFSHQQIEKYEELIVNHRDVVIGIEYQIRQHKNKLYQLVSKENQTQRDSLIQRLGELQVKIENAHFTHFKEIEKLCTNDQKEQFEELTYDLGKIFSHHPPKRH